MYVFNGNIAPTTSPTLPVDMETPDIEGLLAGSCVHVDYRINVCVDFPESNDGRGS